MEKKDALKIMLRTSAAAAYVAEICAEANNQPTPPGVLKIREVNREILEELKKETPDFDELSKRLSEAIPEEKSKPQLGSNTPGQPGAIWEPFEGDVVETWEGFGKSLVKVVHGVNAYWFNGKNEKQAINLIIHALKRRL